MPFSRLYVSLFDLRASDEDGCINICFDSWRSKTAYVCSVQGKNEIFDLPMLNNSWATNKKADKEILTELLGIKFHENEGATRVLDTVDYNFDPNICPGDEQIENSGMEKQAEAGLKRRGADLWGVNCRDSREHFFKMEQILQWIWGSGMEKYRSTSDVKSWMSDFHISQKLGPDNHPPENIKNILTLTADQGSGEQKMCQMARHCGYRIVIGYEHNHRDAIDGEVPDNNLLTAVQLITKMPIGPFNSRHFGELLREIKDKLIVDHEIMEAYDVFFLLNYIRAQR